MMTGCSRVWILAIAVLVSALPAFAVVPGEAQSPNPDNLEWGVPSGTLRTLSWTAGTGALSHDVYFSTNETDVISGSAFQGNQTSAVFQTLELAPEAVYFWRVDEVTATDTNTGSVWSFRTDNRARYDWSEAELDQNFIDPPNEFRIVKYQLNNSALLNNPQYGFGGYQPFFYNNLYKVAVSSSRNGPMICIPTGSPPSV